MPQGQQMCQHPRKIHYTAWPWNDPFCYIWLLAILWKYNVGHKVQSITFITLPLITMFIYFAMQEIMFKLCEPTTISDLTLAQQWTYSGSGKNQRTWKILLNSRKTRVWGSLRADRLYERAIPHSLLITYCTKAGGLSVVLNVMYEVTCKFRQGQDRVIVTLRCLEGKICTLHCQSRDEIRQAKSTNFIFVSSQWLFAVNLQNTKCSWIIFHWVNPKCLDLCCCSQVATIIFNVYFGLIMKNNYPTDHVFTLGRNRILSRQGMRQM